MLTLGNAAVQMKVDGKPVTVPPRPPDRLRSSRPAGRHRPLAAGRAARPAHEARRTRGGARAGILVTGTEVLTGIIADRNGPWLSERLYELGVDGA